MNELILVRCIMCEAIGRKDESFIKLEDSYPAKLQGFRQEAMGYKEVLESVYLCTKHYKCFSKN